MNPPRPNRNDRRRRPLSWVEVVTLALFLGVVLSIAALRAQELRDREVARGAVTAFEALRGAAMDYRLAHGSWPPDAGPGEVPARLEPFLPTGFRFETEEFALRWERWRLPDGLPRHPEIRLLVGISLTTDLPRVAEAVGRTLGADGARYALGDRYTFLIEGL